MAPWVQIPPQAPVKYCKRCEREFTSKKKTQIFCSELCSKMFVNESYLERAALDDNTLNPKVYKRYLIALHGDKCMECGWDKRNPITNLVPIELEHVDGNHKNNKLENLKLLCPNCHSLTPTYKNLNKGNGRFSRRERYKQGLSS